MGLLKRLIVGFVLLMVLGFGLLAWVMRSGGSSERAPAQSSSRPWNWPASYDPGADKKTARNQLVDEWFGKKHSLFSDLKGSSVVIGPDFLKATFEQKQQFSFVLYCWVLDRQPDCAGLTFYEEINHKKFGKFVTPGILTID
jgi:hypothetical protein